MSLAIALGFLATIGGRGAGAQVEPVGEVHAISGEAARQPWSGWWWPAWEGVGPTLFAPNGPLEKYDAYVALTSGASPHTQTWEREQFSLPGNRWAGHCNGFAAAALLEPEPTHPVTVLGLSFSVGDLKGLLTDYHFADTTAWSYGESGELNPADFQRTLLSWLGDASTGFVITFDLGNGESWSYPVYRFESRWWPDPQEEGRTHVRTTLWMADIEVPPGFVGTRPYPDSAGKTFAYTLRGDPLDPVDGTWVSRGPARIWYPDATLRNPYRELVSPGLDHQTIANIVAGSDGTDVAGGPRSTFGPPPRAPLHPARAAD
jgi:hypothetical protein